MPSDLFLDRMHVFPITLCHISNTFSRISNLVDTYCNYRNCENDQKGKITKSQSAFTCLKLTTQTLEQGVKYVQS